MSSEKKVLATVFSKDDLHRKIHDLKRQGYQENELHLVSQDPDSLEDIQGDEKVETAEAGSFKDKFKSMITGESSVREGIKSLDLPESETERYTEDVARGGILIYVDDAREGIDEVLDNVEDREVENPNEAERHQYINSVDNNYDEQEDRFARGETFLEDPTLVKEEDHFSFTTQEKADVEKARGGTSEAEKHTKNNKKYK